MSVKIQLVLDMFHLLETMIGKERIREMTLEEALKLKDDTISLLEGPISPLFPANPPFFCVYHARRGNREQDCLFGNQGTS
jgi:hypothetical protein